MRRPRLEGRRDTAARWPWLVWIVAGWPAVLSAGDAPAARDVTERFVAPPGLRVTLWADDQLAHDIQALTVGARGEIIVSGPGYLVSLHDDDGDGVADRARRLADWPPEGAHGLLAEADALYVSSGAGLFRLADTDGDGLPEGAPERISPGYGGGDHASNGVVRGPDGWLYWIAGNDARVNRAEHATLPGSPVREPVCGAVLRLRPDDHACEIYAHGFRNPYDLDFAPRGEILTYEADGERVQYLPWYSPTRVFDVALGMEHGWILRGWQHAWNRPAEIADNVERLVEVGRGSPTGVVTYRHDSFPPRYRHGVFVVCWSLGRVYFVRLTPAGASYTGELEVFLEARDDTGFAPVDAAVGPAGDLWIAVGGRGTGGAVFRVAAAVDDDAADTAPVSALDRVLRAPQPLASWSRRAWIPEAERLGRGALVAALLDPTRPADDRLRAAEILVERLGGVDAELARRALEASGDSDAVRARLVWALGRSTPGADLAVQRLLARATSDSSARVRREAWEQLASAPRVLADAVARNEWTAGFSHADRRVRAAAILAARRAGEATLEAAIGPPAAIDDAWSLIAALSAAGPWPLAGPPGRDREAWLREALRAAEIAPSARARLDAVRLLQVGLGDVRLVQDRRTWTDGYAAAEIEHIAVEPRRLIASRLASWLPSGDDALDRETARLGAFLEVEAEPLLARLATRWTAASRLEDDIHFLLASARIPGARNPRLRAAIAGAFARLHSKLAARASGPSRFWPTRVEETFRRHLDRDPDLVEALLAHPGFGHPEHALFVAALPNPQRAAATHALWRRVVERAEDGEDVRWTEALVELIGELEEPAAREDLRACFEDPELRDAVALALARRPEEVDRERLVTALESARAEVVRAAARALATRLGPVTGVPELPAVAEALRRYSRRQGESETRTELSALLGRWTGAEAPKEPPGEPHALRLAWLEWSRRERPELVASLEEDAPGAEALLDRLPRIVGLTGDAARGRERFIAAGCAGCHDGARRFGPDLARVTARLSARDLFLAIADPSRDISPAYQPQQIITRDGRVYTGLVVYGSPAATLLQVSQDRTVRFAAEDVASSTVSASSFMPAGLLDGLDDQALADLHAYLRTR